MACSPERKGAVLERMLAPNNLPLRQQSREEGISEATLCRWRRQGRENGGWCLMAVLARKAGDPVASSRR